MFPVKYPPFVETDYGYIQRSEYRQMDSHEEEVIELDSPLADICATGTEVFSFLFIGDQNAGKSTFLHSFCHFSHISFLELTSYIPILSSLFLNSRFLLPSEKSLIQPCDEPPFLDTDIARSSCLITRDDFIFFLHEFGLYDSTKFKDLPDDCRYVVLQFIEIGGDHLDAIIAEAKSPTNIETIPQIDQRHSVLKSNILKRSREMMQSSKKTIYFINASKLFIRITSMDGSLGVESLDEAALQRLAERIQYINDLVVMRNSEKSNGEVHEICFYISRLSQDNIENIEKYKESAAQIFRKCFKRDLEDTSNQVVEDGCSATVERVLAEDNSNSVALSHDDPMEIFSPQTELSLKARLNTISCIIYSLHKWNKWKFNISGIYPIPQRANSDDVDVKFVLTTTVRLLSNNMSLEISQQRLDSSDYIAIKQLFECFREMESTIEREGHEVIINKWITKDILREFLDENASYLELPEALILQKFESLSIFLSNSGFSILHHFGNHAEISFVVKNDAQSQPLLWSNIEQAQSKSEFAMRFPTFKPYLDYISRYFDTHVPGEWWIDNECEITPKEKEEALKCKEGLLTEIQKWWNLLLNELNNNNQTVQLYVDHFIWLLEDLKLLRGMMKQIGHEVSKEIRLSGWSNKITDNISKLGLARITDVNNSSADFILDVS